MNEFEHHLATTSAAERVAMLKARLEARKASPAYKAAMKDLVQKALAKAREAT